MRTIPVTTGGPTLHTGSLGFRIPWEDFFRPLRETLKDSWVPMYVEIRGKLEPKTLLEAWYSSKQTPRKLLFLQTTDMNRPYTIPIEDVGMPVCFHDGSYLIPMDGFCITIQLPSDYEFWNAVPINEN